MLLASIDTGVYIFFGFVVLLAIFGAVGFLIYHASKKNSAEYESALQNLALMKSKLEPNQQMLLQMTMAPRLRNVTVAFLLCFFLGGLGAHEFYLGKIGRGVVYVIFSWTFIPALVSIIQLFTIIPRVGRENIQFETQETLRMIAISSSPTARVLN